jgi:predicted O-methyltransferase YrrM
VNYRIKAVDAHGLHSPFVYELAQNLLYDKSPFYAFSGIEKLRRKLERDSSLINRTDFGRGGERYSQSISHIVKHQAIAPKYGELLFKLSNKFRANNILELGSSLGISTSYLAKANSSSKVYTFEGDPEVAKWAKNNFEALQLRNIQLIEGEFSQTLPDFLKKSGLMFDLVFLDGNHQFQATKDYVELLLKFTNNDTVWILDDIHWSKGMEEFWSWLQTHKNFNVTVDLFQVGLAFPRSGQSKQHFVVKY